jgi:hypothetical protein
MPSFEVTLTEHIDIDVDEFVDACDDTDIEELVSILQKECRMSVVGEFGEFNINSLADTLEAKALVARTLRELEWKLIMRDFS